MSDMVTRLRALANALALGEWIALTETCATAADEIERLRAERDEARRELDEIRRERHDEQRWDCFKEQA